MPAWTTDDITKQDGHTVVVTGASSGIGTTAAEALAAKGARVILAVRNAAKGEAVKAGILGLYPRADLTVSLVDMADLASIRAFAARLVASEPKVDILINNAGLGMQAQRAMTVNGFERQFATNHLGPFALTGLLLPALLRAPAPRVVAIASIAHRTGQIDFDDLQGERVYKGGKAYNQSKLANLMFAFELDRRAQAVRSGLISVAAHPGVASTGFITAIGMPAYKTAIGDFAIRVFGQDAEKGARPGLYAATMPDVKGGQYWGPDGILEVRGNPAPARVSRQARDQMAWGRLWKVSEDLTGVTYGPFDSTIRSRRSA